MTGYSTLHSALEDPRFAEHARWIAIVIATWGRIEEQLSHIYGFLLDLQWERSNLSFYAVQNERTRLTIIRAALNKFHPDTDLAKCWKELEPKVKKAKNWRDTVAHAHWERNNRTGSLQLRSTVVDITYTRKSADYSLHTLKRQAEGMTRVGGAVSDFAVKVHDLKRSRQPSRGKSS